MAWLISAVVMSVVGILLANAAGIKWLAFLFACIGCACGLRISRLRELRRATSWTTAAKGVPAEPQAYLAFAALAPGFGGFAVGVAWTLVVAAAFAPSHPPIALSLILVSWIVAVFGLSWQHVSAAQHFSMLVGFGLCVWGAKGPAPLLFFGIPLGVAGVMIVQLFTKPKFTRKDPEGRLLWGRSEDA